MTPRATRKRIEQVKKVAAKSFGLVIADEHAKSIIAWDEDGSFVPELDDDGHLDTAPRDYFGMALVEVVVPGPAGVQDDLLGGMPTDRWHVPCFGSSDEYHDAFTTAFAAGMKRLGIRFVEKTPRRTRRSH